MSIVDLFKSGIQKNNLKHFAAIANIALIDGEVNENERVLLEKFAKKLDIDEAHYNEVLENSSKYPIPLSNSKEERLQYIFELFQMIYADHEIDEPEEKLIYKYAIGLGCSETKSRDVIAKSIKVFGGGIDFEDYKYLIEKS